MEDDVSEANGEPESHYCVLMVFVNMVCVPLIHEFVEAVVFDEPAGVSHFYHRPCGIQFFWQCCYPEPVGFCALFFLLI